MSDAAFDPRKYLENAEIHQWDAAHRALERIELDRKNVKQAIARLRKFARLMQRIRNRRNKKATP